MKTIKINDWDEIPDNFTGIVDHLITRNKYWYKEGRWHRTDGPAIERTNGRKEWWVEGERSRLDGPAIEYADGTKYWYIENYLYSPIWLDFLIGDSVFLGKKQKGKYDLNWLSFLTDQGIKEFPMIPGMEKDSDFILLYNKVFGATSKP
ncbi:MAG TPA: hypothetical protein PLP33_07220 [Leptospiraceae bacterium]|nr:hypothetical protein [Leptospiraceae bacterium]